MGAFFKECEAAYLRFPPRVVNKIWQRCRYGFARWCCKTDIYIITFEGALGCKTLSKLVYFFMYVLGEDAKGAFLKECEVVYLRFSPRVVKSFGRGMGVRGGVAENILT